MSIRDSIPSGSASARSTFDWRSASVPLCVVVVAAAAAAAAVADDYVVDVIGCRCGLCCCPCRLLRGTIVNRTHGIHKNLYI